MKIIIGILVSQNLIIKNGWNVLSTDVLLIQIQCLTPCNGLNDCQVNLKSLDTGIINDEDFQNQEDNQTKQEEQAPDETQTFSSETLQDEWTSVIEYSIILGCVLAGVLILATVVAFVAYISKKTESHRKQWKIMTIILGMGTPIMTIRTDKILTKLNIQNSEKQNTFK